MAGSLVLYDGVCGLCNHGVQFILQRDDDGAFQFCALQSDAASTILARHDKQVDFDTFVLVENLGTEDERIRIKFDAARAVLGKLGFGWRLVAAAFRLVPRPIGDWAYSHVAQRRYRIFGKADACILPSPEQRARFVGLDALREPPAAA